MREAWANVKIRENLAKQCDALTVEKNDYGIPLFDSRADVVEKAIIEFLVKHGAKVEEPKRESMPKKKGLFLNKEPSVKPEQIGLRPIGAKA